MKKILVLLCLIILSTNIYSQEIQIGSTLKTLSNNISADDFVNSEDLGLWSENKIFAYKIGNENRLLVSMNHYPFAVLTKKNGENIILLDFDGDSILDIETNYLYVPPWIIKLNSTGKISGKVVNNILEMSADVFQSNEKPSDTNEMTKIGNEIVQAAKNINYEDRYLIYHNYLYNYLYGKKEYDSAFFCLQSLYELTKPQNNPTLLIYMAELAYKREEYIDGKKIIEISLQLQPDFIPALVYQYLFEDDLKLKQQYKDNLLKNYKQHWLVKEKI